MTKSTIAFYSVLIEASENMFNESEYQDFLDYRFCSLFQQALLKKYTVIYNYTGSIASLYAEHAK